MSDDRENVAIPLQVVGTKFIAARYIYPQGVISKAYMVVVSERNPETVEHENGAYGFDFVEAFRFTCLDHDGLTFQHLVADRETYYWGQELSLEELSNMPGYEEVCSSSSHKRFVLTDYGAVMPLDDNELVIASPDAFELPSDMQA